MNDKNIQIKSLAHLGIPYGRGICYSGYREGQSPRDGTFPSYEQVVEDLKILSPHWQYLRIYDPSEHADLVLRVIKNEELPLQVMLGSDLAAEQNNPNCPWIEEYSDEQLAEHVAYNNAQISRMIAQANEYPEIAFAVSIGNEASVDWSDHQVPVERLISFAKQVKESVNQPVTFCENYVPWQEKLKPLAAVLDFISVHTYPVWEYRTIGQAMGYTLDNVYSVVEANPDIPVVITEAGWTTSANDKGIDGWNASQELQAQYYPQLMEWVREKQLQTFVFEAFDEPWKGSDDPNEPEKHWGLFTVDRKPKQVMQGLFNV